MSCFGDCWWCCLSLGLLWQWKAKAKPCYSSFQLYLVFVVLLLSCQSCRRLPIYLVVKACRGPNCERVVLVLLMKKVWGRRGGYLISLFVRETHIANQIRFSMANMNSGADEQALEERKQSSRRSMGGRKDVSPVPPTNIDVISIY